MLVSRGAYIFYIRGAYIRDFTVFLYFVAIEFSYKFFISFGNMQVTLFVGRAIINPVPTGGLSDPLQYIFAYKI